MAGGTARSTWIPDIDTTLDRACTRKMSQSRITALSALLLRPVVFMLSS